MTRGCVFIDFLFVSKIKIENIKNISISSQLKCWLIFKIDNSNINMIEIE
jgi:hypothetical protein